MDRCYINRLPPEIISHIFQIMSSNDPQIPLIASWVSRYWRKAALSTHSLWSTIATLNPDMISEYIDRNPTCPITFTVICRSSRVALASECLSLFITHRLQSRLYSMYLRVVHDDLEEDVGKWQKLLKTLFLPGIQHYQQLNTLFVGYALNYAANPTPSDGLPVFVEAPELRSLHLRGLAVNSETCASNYPSLKELSIINT